jgi:aminopeptidase N
MYWSMRKIDAAPIWLGSMAETLLTERVAEHGYVPFQDPSTDLTGMKGGYVIYMLRGLMFDRTSGDQDFIAMIHDFTSTYAHRSVSTEDFKSVVEKHMKPEMDLGGNQRMDWFFREWVYGTELPTYNLEYSLSKGADGKPVVHGKLTQSGVSEQFRMRVPVYGKFGSKTMLIGAYNVTGNHTQEFSAPLPEQPKKVLLNANYDILCAAAEAKEAR